MAEYKFYERRTQTATIAEGVEEQCLVDLELKLSLYSRSPVPDPNGNLNVSENQERVSFLESAGSTDTNMVADRRLSSCQFLIDLNEPACNLEDSEASKEQAMLTHEVESTYLVSDGVIEGLDISLSEEPKKGFKEFLCVADTPKPSQVISQSAATESFSLVKEPDSDKLSSNLNFVQDDGLRRENVVCEQQIHVSNGIDSRKPPQKLKRKKHRPKVVVDGKPLTPKPATPKQAREKKPRPNPKLATPKRARVKKTKLLATPKPARVEKQRLSAEVEIENRCQPVQINETQVPVARALDFQPRGKSKRSKRRRLTLFNLLNLRARYETEKDKKDNSERLFTVNWGRRSGRRRRRPYKVGEKLGDTSEAVEVGDKSGDKSEAIEVGDKSETIEMEIDKLKPTDTDTEVSNLMERKDMEVLRTETQTLKTETETPTLRTEITETLTALENSKEEGSTSDVKAKGRKRAGRKRVKEIDIALPTSNEGAIVPHEGPFDPKKRKMPSDVKPKGRKRIKRVGEKQMDIALPTSTEGAIVPYEGPFVKPKGRKRVKRIGGENEGAIIPYGRSKRKMPKVNLDSETLRVWNFLMNASDEQAREENQEWWEKERQVFVGRVSSFNARMFQIQGDRGFRRWKGSVLDSVVGVFLTQNVADHLSSNAFMSLVSMFPPKPTCQDTACDEVLEIKCSQESVGSSMTEYDEEGNTYFVNEPEPERNKEPGKVIPVSTLLFPIEETVSTLPFPVEEVVLESDGNTKLQNEDTTTISPLEEVVQSDEISKPQHDDATTFSPVEEVVQGEPQHEDVTISTKKGRRRRKSPKAKKREDKFDWDSLRMKYSTGLRSSDHMDTVDWEAVRLADIDKLQDIIKERGQQTIIGGRIQNFLNRVVDLHKSLDLEWLRNTPPDLAKKYLLAVDGLGLKSVECVRLLCLNNVAFPVDTNVGRIAVRLGWVPLQPLPEELQIHLLEQYPMMDSIQKYLWPRLCTLDQKTLYELHYQMITFGKVFCTKRNPNCNSCPMRTECRHFASAFASSKLALPGPSNNMEANLEGQIETFNAPPSSVSSSRAKVICEPIIEEPIELASPKLEAPQSVEEDHEIEYDSDGIPFIKLNLENFKTSLLNLVNNDNDENSKALVALNPYVASLPRPKLKDVGRLRTEHQVFELPRNHILLEGLEQTESDEEIQYHLAIWRPGETVNSLEPPKESCNSTESLCNNQTCFSCNNIREQNANEVRGTLLIPCRVAMRCGFPLNGTYFQVNEVFVDHYTSYTPLRIQRNLIWNLRTRTAYFGSSISAILKGVSTEIIQKCFWKGIVCVRGFDRATRAPKPLGRRFHCLISKMDKVKEKGKKNDDAQQ